MYGAQPYNNMQTMGKSSCLLIPQDPLPRIPSIRMGQSLKILEILEILQ